MLLEGHTVAVIEDDPVMGESLVQALSLEGCHVDWWKTGAEAERGLRSASPDLVICDMRLPDTTGEALFLTHAALMPLPPFLFVTAYGDIDEAVALMRQGAADYVTKPFDLSKVLARVQDLIQKNTAPRHGTGLGTSRSIKAVEAALRRICDLTSPVLLTGETGAGKEVCARFLHGLSARSQEPFIAVNCAAIPGDAMEREIFGYRGASAQAFHRGFAERARGGSCSSTKCRSSRLLSRPSCCGWSRRGSIIALAASRPWSFTAGSSARPTATCRRWSGKGAFARISSTGSAG